MGERGGGGGIGSSGGYSRNCGSLPMNKTTGGMSQSVHGGGSPMSRGMEMSDGRYVGKENVVKKVKNFPPER